MHDKQEFYEFQIEILENLKAKLANLNEKSERFEKLNVAIALVNGVLSSTPEIGYYAYDLYLKNTNTLESTAQKYWLSFLMQYGIFDVYQNIIPPGFDAVTNELPRLNPRNSKNISHYCQSACGFFSSAIKNLAEAGCDYYHQNKIPFYLYLNKLLTTSQRELFINNFLKTISPEIKQLKDNYSRNLILVLKGNDGELKWRKLIDYIVAGNNSLHPLVNAILSYYDKILKRCGINNMLLFLIGNKEHKFIHKEIALLVQLQMIEYSLQEEVQEEVQEETGFLTWVRQF